jgi:hypothetical protein
MSQVVIMTDGKCIVHPFFKILKNLNTTFLCRSAMEMHRVENLFWVVSGARAHPISGGQGTRNLKIFIQKGQQFAK